jgi:hypothetical protein
MEKYGYYPFSSEYLLYSSSYRNTVSLTASAARGNENVADPCFKATLRLRAYISTSEPITLIAFARQ